MRSQALIAAQNRYKAKNRVRINEEARLFMREHRAKLKRATGNRLRNITPAYALTNEEAARLRAMPKQRRKKSLQTNASPVIIDTVSKGVTGD